MYYYRIFFALFCAVFLPFGAIADNGERHASHVSDVSDAVVYDFAHSARYLVDGRSMESYGFTDGMRVSVVPASDFRVGDVIAFTCTRDVCDGAYIKKITQKNGSCYWVEGRKDVWKENGKRKKSMDSRTTYGWLCDDEIAIIGVVMTNA